MAYVGVAIGIFGIVVAIAIATKSSCPYVYVDTGEEFTFQGEIYSGAVLRNLERHDYLPLPLLRPVKGEYRLRIANELKERQYVNMAELVEVQHPQGTQILLDQDGLPRLIADPQRPLSALSANGIDQSEKIRAVEQQAFLFDEADATRNSLTLRFNRVPGAEQAQLVLNAKNSMWFDYLYGRFAEMMGTNYSAWMSRLEAMTREQRQQQQIDQDFPLSVYLKDAQGQWQLVGRLPLAGPLGWRDLTLPIDLQTAPDDIVELRLETGYLFWEVDYAALDFTNTTDLKTTTLLPRTAKDQDRKSQLDALRSDDDQYLQQPYPGQYTELHFPATPAPAGTQQSFFLHVKGYYEHVRDFREAPDMARLEKFRQPHYFDQFSKAEFQRLQGATWTAPEPVN